MCYIYCDQGSSGRLEVLLWNRALELQNRTGHRSWTGGKLAHDRRPVREFPEPDDAMATTDIMLCVTDAMLKVVQADGKSFFLAHDRIPVREFPEPDDAMATTDITLCVTDVVMRVAQADGESYFRPMIGDLPGEYQTVMMSFVRLIQGCWAEDVSLRPTSRRLLRLMKRLNPFQSVSCLYKTIFVSLPLTSVSAKRGRQYLQLNSVL